MNLNIFRDTWNGTKAENKFFRTVIILQLIVTIGIVGYLISRDQIVVLSPPEVHEKMQVSKNTANPAFKKSWALYIATLMGNVNVGNADFVVSEVTGMMRPDVEIAFKSSLAQQLEVIKRNQVSISYEPNQVYFEKETSKIFVIGKSLITGTAGKSNKVPRVFELELDIQHYSPVITLIETYEGDPKTLAWREKQERREERESARAARDQQ